LPKWHNGSKPHCDAQRSRSNRPPRPRLDDRQSVPNRLQRASRPTSIPSAQARGTSNRRSNSLRRPRISRSCPERQKRSPPWRVSRTRWQRCSDARLENRDNPLTGGQVGSCTSDEAGAGSQAIRRWRSLIGREVTPAGPQGTAANRSGWPQGLRIERAFRSYFCCSPLSVIDLEVASVLKSIWMIMLPFVVPLPLQADPLGACRGLSFVVGSLVQS
jgi:hypothetical protein